MRSSFLMLAALLALAGCGDLPQPFRGNPGGLARRLAMPMALRLAVPPPTEALLSNDAAERFAEALATALQGQEVPAVATPAPLPLDWRVQALAEVVGQRVQLRFRLINPDGQQAGAATADPVPLRDWDEPSAATLRRLAEQAANSLAGLILQVEAANKATDPAALTPQGPPRIRFIGVRNAPGDGNVALALRMRERMANLGLVVQDTADGAQYGLEGDVVMAPAGGGQQRVEVQWVVSRRDGLELGRVVQLNEVPTGSLNGLWGDVAYVIAEEAAPGIRQVISNATAPRDDAPAAAREDAPAAEATPPAPAAVVPAAAPAPMPAAAPPARRAGRRGAAAAPR